MDAVEIKKMSTRERLQAMEALWDALLHEDSEMESPQWHENVLKERKRLISGGEVEFVSLKDLKTAGPFMTEGRWALETIFGTV